MKTLSLNGIWKMTGNGYAVNGTVPGSVYSFLYLDNQLLPDPYYRDNEKIYLELASHEYTFEKTFSYTRSGVPTFLVFEGLDTLCSVYLNGAKIADTDNMHVRYDFDVTNALLDGEKVATVPGVSFGADDCLRLSYSLSEADIEEGLARIKRFVSQLA